MQIHERIDVRAILFPRRIGSITFEISRALPVTFTHGANALQIVQRLRFDPPDRSLVEVERRHSPQQKIG